MSAAGYVFSFGKSVETYGRSYVSYRKSKQDYCKNFIMEDSLSSLAGLFSSTDKINCTEKTITVQDNTFGESYYRVFFHKGFPSLFETKTYGQLKHTVMAYRSRFGKQGSLQTNYHFLNGRLLYVHLCFSKADQLLQTAVHTSLNEKYSCSLPEQGPFLLQDVSGNRIKGYFGMELNLYYLSGNITQQQLVKDEVNRQAFRKKKVDAKRLRTLQQIL